MNCGEKSSWSVFVCFKVSGRYWGYISVVLKQLKGCKEIGSINSCIRVPVGSLALVPDNKWELAVWVVLSQKVLVQSCVFGVLPLYCFTFVGDTSRKAWKRLNSPTVFLRILYSSCQCPIACYRNVYFQTAVPILPSGPADRVTLFRWQDILCAKVIKCRQKPFLKQMNSTSRAVYFPLWEKLNNDVFMGDWRV